MKKGEIIRVPFPFTDLTGSNLRPSLVLITGKGDVTVSFFTTQIRWKELTDVIIKPTSQNGFKRESLLRLSKLATVDLSLLVGILGEIDANTI